MSTQKPAMIKHLNDWMDFSSVCQSDDLQYNLALSPRIIWENNLGSQTQASNAPAAPLKTFLWQKSATAAFLWRFSNTICSWGKCSFHIQTGIFFFISRIIFISSRTKTQNGCDSRCKVGALWAAASNRVTSSTCTHQPTSCQCLERSFCSSVALLIPV